MYFYVLGGMFLMVLFVMGYLKCKHRFWYYQFVFHTWDWLYWGRKGSLKGIPGKHKNSQITFASLADIDWTPLDRLCNQSLQPFYVGHSMTCYASMRWKEEFSFTDCVRSSQRLVGYITTRPLCAYLSQQPMDFHLVDAFLDPSIRQQNELAYLAQTHLTHLSDIQTHPIGLFYSDRKIPVVPLVSFTTCQFSMKEWKTVSKHPLFHVMRVQKDNFAMFYEFFLTQKEKYLLFVYNAPGNMLELIEKGIWYVYMIMANNAIVSVYFFRHASKNRLHLTGCLQNDFEYFLEAFKISLANLLQQHTHQYTLLQVPSIGLNALISQNLKRKTHPMNETKCGYYLYNYLYPSFSSNQSIILH